LCLHVLIAQHIFIKKWKIINKFWKSGMILIQYLNYSAIQFVSHWRAFISYFNMTLCKQTCDLITWQNLISTCAVHTFKPGLVLYLPKKSYLLLVCYCASFPITVVNLLYRLFSHILILRYFVPKALNHTNWWRQSRWKRFITLYTCGEIPTMKLMN
jgi:hypothetical protein